MKTIQWNITAGRGITFITLLTLTLAACKKELRDYSFIPERQFMPGNIRITQGETNVRLEWNASLFTQGRPTSYTVQLSRDSAFAGEPAFNLQTQTNAITITDSLLPIRTRYFARIRTNAEGNSSESFWVYSAGFQINGEQIFSPLADADIKDKSVLLKWRPTTGLTRIVLTPTAGGTAIEVPLTPADITANQKLVTGLTQQTEYRAEIFAGNLSKGFLTFTTKEPSIFTVILSPGDDLLEAVSNAENGDVIGLQPGTYDVLSGTGEWANLVITEKTITIASVSNNPANTRVNYREITLRGNGAGVTLRGINFDGLPAGNNSLYFLNLVGLNSDADPATFTNIVVDNCRVSNFGNCFFRGNRAANNAHKIEAIRVLNTVIADCRILNAWTFLTMDKLEFRELEFRNSTIYNLGRGFIQYATNFTVPVVPRVIVDQCTINSVGRDARNNFFIDCNANQVEMRITNSIIANMPMPGQTTGNSMVRATGSQNSVLSHCNFFNLTNGANPPVNLTWPALFAQSNNRNIDLGWTGNNSSFALPAGSELRTASSSNGPIGDPRWAQ